MRTEDWGILQNIEDYLNALHSINPRFNENINAWDQNCQRCVPAYEMRRRGYNVSANPISPSDSYLSYHPYEVWKDPIIHDTPGTGRDAIEKAMAS